MDFSYLLIAILFLLGFSFIVKRIERQRLHKFSVSNYRKRDYFLTKNENTFYKKLLYFYENRFLIIPQVNLDKLFYSDYSNRSRIDRKSVDFVFLERQNFRPIIAIELDDSTHTLEDRVKRDLMVNEIFEKNNFPLIRINSQDDVAMIIDKYLI